VKAASSKKITEKTVRIGLVGCGYWGPNLVRNFHETPGAAITHVADTDPARLAKIRARYPFLQCTRRYQDLIDNPAIDAIAIAVPVQLHHQIARAALEMGKHVWVEKPLAFSVKEGEDLVHLARRKNKTLFVDHTFVYHGPVQALKRQLKSIGTLRYFDSVRVNLGLFQNDINVIWDLAPHDLSILLYVVGQEPVEVLASGAAHVNPEIENSAFMTVRFRGSFIAHFHFNWLSPVKIRQTLICGSRKMIAYNDLDPIEPLKIYDTGVQGRKLDKKTILVDYRTGDVFSPKIDRTEALAGACSDFIRAIRTGKAPVSDGRFGLKILRILEASSRSLASNSRFVRIK
jgi:predicted dehydrogenase